MERYGFIFLYRANESDKEYKPYFYSEKLYSTILECIQAATTSAIDVPETLPLKLGYFKILSNSEIVKDLNLGAPQFNKQSKKMMDYDNECLITI